SGARGSERRGVGRSIRGAFRPALACQIISCTNILYPKHMSAEARAGFGKRDPVMWSPFTEEHDQFRMKVRKFAENEILPHAEEWEAACDFPNHLFKRAGELGILGAHYKEAHGGSGGDYWFSVAKAEELPRCGSGGIAMA